jgi:hypothetical protein
VYLNLRCVPLPVDVLAEKFGSTGTRLWELLIKSTMLNAWIGISFGLILVAFAVPCFLYGRNDEYGDYVPLRFAGGLVAFIALLFIFMNIQGIFLPEAVLIKSLIR